MLIYHLARPEEITSYDEAHGFVVYAEFEQQAREIAASQKGDEGAIAWLNPADSTCTAIGVATDPKAAPGVVLRDFNAA